MTHYKINSRNLSNSLVFYRALFNQMPKTITPSQLQFKMPGIDLDIVECNEPNDSSKLLKLDVSNFPDLEAISKRMSRFKSVAGVQGNCEVLDKAIGLIDPDGSKWLVGDPNADVQFEKCYIIGLAN